MTQTTTPVVPAVLLHDVQAVLIAAWERLGTDGWRRYATSRDGDGLRLVDALNLGSALACRDRTVHLLAFACTAMAIELHANVAAHELLPDALADQYLDPNTSDDRLHQLDASIVVRYNTERCGGYEDARALIMTAHATAAATIAAQL
jgi:hypothetical protein